MAPKTCESCHDRKAYRYGLCKVCFDEAIAYMKSRGLEHSTKEKK